MKAALVFAGPAAATTTFRPYRSRAFLAALAEAGITPVVIDLDLAPGRRFDDVPAELPGLVTYRNHVDRLALIVAQEGAAIVQTFGATADLGPVWGEAARAARPLVHFVSSVGTVAETPAGRPRGLGDLVHRGRGLAAWPARRASRHVAAVVGSNRADMGRHFRHGFFARARFSLVAPPVAARVPLAAAAEGRVRRSVPVLGVFDPEASPETLALMSRAVALTGHSDLFRLHVAPVALARRGDLPPGATVVDTDDPAGFVRDIDVLVVPCPDDRASAAVLAALAARKSVVVPDTGTLAELVDYGRRGVLFPADSAYHLAMAVNVMTEAWTNRPFSFEGIEEAIDRAAPEAVARVFVDAFRRLA
ncbi:glycosyltransferase [Rhodoplanes azumiensis]|uniref:Glycosyltransferase n=1 Tax=Rhodoplanes azumiensis TaxID=1897628 RepID=A0ABW5AM19_9BRAD